MDDCVQDMKKETGGRLALVILTHYHADHMSGFASNYDDFANFDHVGAVWITNRLDPENPAASKFMAQITSVAQQLQLQLGARRDPAAVEAQRKVDNALGVARDADGEDGGGGSNAKALKLLQSGFKSKPPVYYYQGGDTPTLPAELEGMITAEILGPSPKDSAGVFAASDNKKEQYLAAVGDNGVPDVKPVTPFEKKWPASAADYPPETFDEFDSGLVGQGADAASATVLRSWRICSRICSRTCWPPPPTSSTALSTTRASSCCSPAREKNCSSWATRNGATGRTGCMASRHRQPTPASPPVPSEILGSIDFYKVGHHGSTNATPIPAVGALNQQCAAMCSTATGAYGSPAKKTEVPRTALMEALETRTGNRLVRSDWVAAGQEAPDKEAKDELADLPAGFSTPGELYIDYNL